MKQREKISKRKDKVVEKEREKNMNRTKKKQTSRL